VRRLLSGWQPVALLVALIGIWELYVDAGGADPLILSAPHAIAQSLYDDRSLLWSNLLTTAQEVVFGLAVASVAGLALAIAIHFSSTLRRALYPLLVASQAVPIPILAPLLVLWLGFGIGPKLAVIALVCFFPIVVTTLSGLAAVDPGLIRLMASFDAPRRRTFWHIELPSALPRLLTGAKIAAAIAVIAAVLAELSGANSGLGYLYEQSEAQLRMPRAYACVVVLCALAVALFGLLTVAERRLVPWAYKPLTGDLRR